jgi:hypothetical protein
MIQQLTKMWCVPGLLVYSTKTYMDSVTNYCPCNSSKRKSLFSQIPIIVRCVQSIYMYRLLPS